MRLSELGEFGLIQRLHRLAPSRRSVRVGIGDDAAWIQNKSGFLVTADLLIEGIHFDLKWTSLFALGVKTLAVNLSDIAAMGGVPGYLLVSLGIPAGFHSEQVEELYRGIKTLSSKTGVALIGGDTSVAPSLIISACLIGHAPYQPIRRRGAKAGNDIYVTGTIGDSAMGLELLRNGRARPKIRPVAFLIRRHQQPTPRTAVGALLARERLATAMIDISDGLVQDLGHICKASGTGARIWEEKLPLSTAYRKLAAKQGSIYALSGGEDYELLFCARRRDRARIDKIQQQTHVPITRIGACTSSRDGIKVMDAAGKPLVLSLKGHDHFKGK